MRSFYIVLVLWLISAVATGADTSAAFETTQVAPGVWRLRAGTPEPFVPTRYNTFAPRQEALAAMPAAETLPFDVTACRAALMARGCAVTLPLAPEEHIYGFGLQLRYFEQTGKRTVCRISDNQNGEGGDSHAAVPVYFSTRGYGIFVDTLRYAAFHCGTLDPVGAPVTPASGGLADSIAELYKARTPAGRVMAIDVPAATGLDIYVFAGPALGDAIRRYNLYSGGGCLPPLWGLGMWYRGYTKFAAADILRLAQDFRERHLPFDVMGLEPGWHTHAYSCTFAWSPERWPDPDGFLARMAELRYRLNLWEHAFVHPSSPLHDALLPYSGDYRVWQGLVPDFTVPEACAIFAGHHEREFVRKGVAGFKLDECDNQPLAATPWSFPEMSRFPSGIDGEQMHSLIGLQYQRVLYDIYRRNNIRTYSKVRASHALAAPIPFVLYSDAYDHRDYVRAIATSGFGGLLWQPEVRECSSVEDLYRRIQVSVFSPQAVVDAWYMRNPPWRQIKSEENNNGQFMPEWEAVEAECRKLFELRMQLVPYLYSAFADYAFSGVPPFRALVADYPSDAETFAIDNEYLMGQSMLVAPIFAGEKTRSVYLPEGRWHCFWTGKTYEGRARHEIEPPLDQIPVFVRDGSLVPMAKPMEYIPDGAVFDVTVRVFGDVCRPFVLYEDDGVSFDFEQGIQNRVTLTWAAEGGKVERSGNYSGSRYTISAWEKK